MMASNVSPQLRVSSRAPVWGASALAVPLGVVCQFQVVPPCGGHPISRRVKSGGNVSSRAPGWGASSRGLSLISQYAWFQVVPPCGGHPVLPGSSCLSHQFQVVPPCGGHLAYRVHRCFPLLVSSRAPVWGASRGYGNNRYIYSVSSRAPVWGASLRPYISAMSRQFQVVPPYGGHRQPAKAPGHGPGFKSCPRVGGIHGHTRGLRPG